MKRTNLIPEMSKGAAVYSGPNPFKYNQIGSINKGARVWIYSKEGLWYYVEYKNKNGSWECGYAEADRFIGQDGHVPSEINPVNPVNAGYRYLLRAAYTYYGYNDTYPRAQYLAARRRVDYLGYKTGGYALIEYSIGSDKYERAFIKENDLSVDPVTK